MNEITPAFQGEVQLRRWSESSTQGVQVTFALAESADLDKFKGLDGKRFMAVLVQIGDDEQPVLPNPLISKQSANPRSTREPLGDLCWRAVQWCKEPEFHAWVAGELDCHPAAVGEEQAKQFIQRRCKVESRRELDSDRTAMRNFNVLIRAPYQKYLIARGIVR